MSTCGLVGFEEIALQNTIKESGLQNDTNVEVHKKTISKLFPRKV
jgi:hypothetical protein